MKLGFAAQDSLSMRFGFASEETHPEELPGEEVHIKNSISSKRGGRNMDGLVMSQLR